MLLFLNDILPNIELPVFKSTTHYQMISKYIFIFLCCQGNIPPMPILRIKVFQTVHYIPIMQLSYRSYIYFSFICFTESLTFISYTFCLYNQKKKLSKVADRTHMFSHKWIQYSHNYLLKYGLEFE